MKRIHVGTEGDTRDLFGVGRCETDIKFRSESAATYVLQHTFCLKGMAGIIAVEGTKQKEKRSTFQRSKELTKRGIPSRLTSIPLQLSCQELTPELFLHLVFPGFVRKNQFWGYFLFLSSKLAGETVW